MSIKINWNTLLLGDALYIFNNILAIIKGLLGIDREASEVKRFVHVQNILFASTKWYKVRQWSERENQQDATIRCLLSTLSQHISGIIMPIFRRTKTVCYCMWCAALFLLDVVGSGCGALRCRMRALWSRTVTFTVLTPYNAVPHNRYQPHPAEPAQYTTCSNTRSLFSWRWAEWCPKHVETVLIINIWLLHLVGFLSHFTICLRCTVTGT